MVWRIVALAAAWLWAGAVVAFYYGYHFAQLSSPSMVSDGHTYYTHSAAESLAQSDPVSGEIVTIALALTVAAGTIDLAIRLTRRMTAVGVGAVCVGGMLTLFSWFGLLLGFAGIGTAGLLVILSGLPMKSVAGNEDQTGSTLIEPCWCPDPTGRFDFRYWDGSVWSSRVSTSGRLGTDPI
jgi:hypothetical protein